MKKRHLTKFSKILIVAVIFLIIAFIAGNKIYKNYKYKQTYEYKLLEKGYELSEVKELEKLFNNKRLDYILKIEVNKNLIDLAKAPYYIDKNLEDYLKYIEDNDADVNTAILKINPHTNYNFYEHDIEDTDYSTTLMVNKYYKLKEDYVPENLVNLSGYYAWGTGKQATEETLEAFKQMQSACKEETGITLMINSAYRGYEDQQRVYEYYKKLYDETYADSIAARPGHSEHQTGLSLDIFSYTDRLQKTFKDGKTYAWLKDNCYKYGFIIRYPEGKENITGFAPESWHYRYVGKDIAKDITEKGITFDEYYEYYLNK
jgi:D-alanyl-D-alanine carboxypeptidase